MAKYILAILRSQLMIVFSWGFHNPVALNNGLQFQVNGYKHKGKVQVKYDEGSDLFCVILLDRTGKETRKQEGIYLDGLVDTIDAMVERTEDYATRVKKQYSL